MAERLLENAIQQGKLSQAYLITAGSPAAAEAEAREFIRRLFCEKHTGCGVCPMCKRTDSGNNVDLMEIARDEEFKIGAVREVGDFLAKRAYESPYRCIYIREAQRMSHRVQNYLLKPLEEPGEGVVFVLSSSQPDRLLPTIQSRCVHVPVKAEPTAVVLEKLGGSDAARRAAAALSGGYVAEALAILKDEELAAIRADADHCMEKLARLKNPSVYDMEQRLLSHGKRMGECVYAMLTMARDAMTIRLRVNRELVNADYEGTTSLMAQRFTTGLLRFIIEILANTYETLVRCPNANQKLAAEGMLFQILEVRSKWLT